MMHRGALWRKRGAARLLLGILALGRPSGASDQTAWHAEQAEAAVRAGSLARALGEFEQYFRGARPVERDYIRARVSALGASLTIERIGELCRQSRLAMAVLGTRLPTEEAGPEVVRAARRELGWSEDPSRALEELAVGLALPLSGRSHLLGERVLRGALVAAEAFPPGARTLELWTRDTGSTPEGAAAAVDELVRSGAAAVIGSPDRAESAAQAARSAALGVPFLALAPGDEGPGVFRLLYPAAAREEALAAHVVHSGLRRVAVFSPESSYGKSVAGAFVAALRKRGLVPIANLTFPERATTFIGPVKKLAQARPDAVFIPAPAPQLELIAAQLATTGVARVEGGRAKGAGAVVISPGDGVGERFLARVGRYLQGAVLAPIFCVDVAPASFVDGYREAYGEEPLLVDALAYDAVAALRAALASLDPNQGRAGLMQWLSAGQGEGLTGPLGFASSNSTHPGARAGAPQLFRVAGDRLVSVEKAE